MKYVRLLFLVVSLFVFSTQTGYAKLDIPFQCTLDLESETINFTLPIDENQKLEGTIKQNQDPNSKKAYDVQLSLDHLQLLLFDIAADINGSIKITENSEGQDTTAIQLVSQYMLLNYKPIDELKANLVLEGDVLRVEKLQVGPFIVKGTVNLSSQKSMDLDVLVHNLEMEQFLMPWQDYFKNTPSIEGFVDGEFHLTGPLENPQINAKLSSARGRINSLEYDTMVLRLVGRYPYMELEDSIVTKTNGMSFKLQGPVQLDDRDILVAQIKALKLSPIVNQDDSQIEWVIKKVPDTETTEFSYFIRKNDPTEHPHDEGSGLLGLERRMDF